MAIEKFLNILYSLVNSLIDAPDIEPFLRTAL